MKKIIHMSDLHIGYKNLLDRFHKICIKLSSGEYGNPSDIVIVITGDLVDNANNTESIIQTKNELIAHPYFQELLLQKNIYFLALVR